MRFSDQIDPGNGALRSWQAESERLLFDQSSRSQWGRGEHGGDGASLYSETLPLLLDGSQPHICSIIPLVLAP